MEKREQDKDKLKKLQDLSAGIELHVSGAKDKSQDSVYSNNYSSSIISAKSKPRKNTGKLSIQDDSYLSEDSTNYNPSINMSPMLSPMASPMSPNRTSQQVPSLNSQLKRMETSFDLNVSVDDKTGKLMRKIILEKDIFTAYSVLRAYGIWKHMKSGDKIQFRAAMLFCAVVQISLLGLLVVELNRTDDDEDTEDTEDDTVDAIRVVIQFLTLTIAIIFITIQYIRSFSLFSAVNKIPKFRKEFATFGNDQTISGGSCNLYYGAFVVLHCLYNTVLTVLGFILSIALICTSPDGFEAVLNAVGILFVLELDNWMFLLVENHWQMQPEMFILRYKIHENHDFSIIKHVTVGGVYSACNLCCYYPCCCCCSFPCCSGCNCQNCCTNCAQWCECWGVWCLEKHDTCQNFANFSCKKTVDDCCSAQRRLRIPDVTGSFVYLYITLALGFLVAFVYTGEQYADTICDPNPIGFILDQEFRRCNIDASDLGGLMHQTGSDGLFIVFWLFIFLIYVLIINVRGTRKRVIAMGEELREIYSKHYTLMILKNLEEREKDGKSAFDATMPITERYKSIAASSVSDEFDNGYAGTGSHIFDGLDDDIIDDTLTVEQTKKHVLKEAYQLLYEKRVLLFNLEISVKRQFGDYYYKKIQTRELLKIFDKYLHRSIEFASVRNDYLKNNISDNEDDDDDNDNNNDEKSKEKSPSKSKTASDHNNDDGSSVAGDPVTKDTKYNRDYDPRFYYRIPKDSDRIKKMFVDEVGVEAVSLAVKCERFQAKANISDKKYDKIKNSYKRKMQQLYLLYRKAKFWGEHVPGMVFNEHYEEIPIETLFKKKSKKKQKTKHKKKTQKTEENTGRFGLHSVGLNLARWGKNDTIVVEMAKNTELNNKDSKESDNGGDEVKGDNDNDTDNENEKALHLHAPGSGPAGHLEIDSKGGGSQSASEDGDGDAKNVDPTEEETEEEEEEDDMARYKVTEKMVKECGRLAESYYLPIPERERIEFEYAEYCKAKLIANTVPKLIVHQMHKKLSKEKDKDKDNVLKFYEYNGNLNTMLNKIWKMDRFRSILQSLGEGMGKKQFFQLFKQYRDTNIQDNVISRTLGADSLEAVKKLYDEYIHESIDDEKEKEKEKDKATQEFIDNRRPSFRRPRKNKIKKENPLDKVKKRVKTETVEQLFAFLFSSEMEVINLLNKCLRYIDVRYKLRIPSCKECQEDIVDKKRKWGDDLLVYIEDIPKREEKLAARKTRIACHFCYFLANTKCNKCGRDLENGWHCDDHSYNLCEECAFDNIGVYLYTQTPEEHNDFVKYINDFQFQLQKEKEERQRQLEEKEREKREREKEKEKEKEKLKDHEKDKDETKKSRTLPGAQRARRFRKKIDKKLEARRNKKEHEKSKHSNEENEIEKNDDGDVKTSDNENQSGSENENGNDNDAKTDDEKNETENGNGNGNGNGTDGDDADAVDVDVDHGDGGGQLVIEENVVVDGQTGASDQNSQHEQKKSQPDLENVASVSEEQY